MEYELKEKKMQNNLRKKHYKVASSSFKRLQNKAVHGDKCLVTVLKLSTLVAHNPLLKGVEKKIP
jgi:hypothetical protein